MGWNTTLTVVKDCTPEDLAEQLAYGEPTSCDAATDAAVVVAVSSDVVLTGESASTQEIVKAVSTTGRRTVTVCLNELRDSYELRVNDGPRLVRHLAQAGGQITNDEGERLPREELADEEESAPDRFLALWQITGGLMMGDWYFDPNGRTVALAGREPATVDHESARHGLRRWFGRA